ncbi:MAG: HPP family protein [Dehalococcoidia bacterium]
MRMRLSLVDRKLRNNFPRYLCQVSLAAGVLAAALGFDSFVAGGALNRAVIVAAVASTAFILFITPHSKGSRPRRVIGGPLIGLAVPGALALLAPGLVDVIVSSHPLLFILYAALIVGVTMFLMAATGTEHPPGAGVALGVVAHGFSWQLALFVAGGVAIMVCLHWLLRNELKDLD